MTLSNPAINRILTRADFRVSDYSPWEGWMAAGWPVTTIPRGRVIVEDGRLSADPGSGKVVPRKIDPVVPRRPAG